jgi:cytochrome c553
MSKKNFLIISLLIFTQAYAESPQKTSENITKNETRLSKCMGCHGQHFEKSVFEKATIVKGQSAAAIEASLLEYKAGTRNKVGFGEMMKGQVKEISDDDLKAMATSIAGKK